jgi:hypothetical protein
MHFLCVALGFIPGGNLCHADGKSAEDHCIRTKDVIFVFESLERSMQAGPEFRKFYHQNNMQLELCQIIFPFSKIEAYQPCKVNSPCHLGSHQSIIYKKITRRASQIINTKRCEKGHERGG